ncbi:MAG TPA: ribosome-associated translation inhibitor RaiA [Marmoricola sp.]|nr:ribosome-associated translation inhibitor RaiA [Marmoricola sp.]HNO39111.1 ribosome-associated translation inhibitor RaiA [Marmoricola sp.]
MDVVVTSRQTEITDRFREHVEDKLARLEKHDQRIIRIDVVVVERDHRREPDKQVRVELTARSKGPVVRAEAVGEDKMAALDLAVDKMQAQMRKAADRRKVHRGNHTPESVHAAMARSLPEDLPEQEEVVAERKVGPVTVTGEGPLVVREKTHQAAPMTCEQALYEMELVGHDFYLYVDKETEKPSVVYRRKGYDYGVITLELS